MEPTTMMMAGKSIYDILAGADRDQRNAESNAIGTYLSAAGKINMPQLNYKQDSGQSIFDALGAYQAQNQANERYENEKRFMEMIMGGSNQKDPSASKFSVDYKKLFNKSNNKPTIIYKDSPVEPKRMSDYEQYKLFTDDANLRGKESFYQQ